MRVLPYFYFYYGGTLMCPTVFVVFRTLKMASREVQSLELFVPHLEAFQTPTPPKFNVYIQAASNLRRHCGTH